MTLNLDLKKMTIKKYIYSHKRSIFHEYNKYLKSSNIIMYYYKRNNLIKIRIKPCILEITNNFFNCWLSLKYSHLQYKIIIFNNTINLK